MPSLNLPTWQHTLIVHVHGHFHTNLKIDESQYIAFVTFRGCLSTFLRLTTEKTVHQILVVFVLRGLHRRYEITMEYEHASPTSKKRMCVNDLRESVVLPSVKATQHVMFEITALFNHLFPNPTLCKGKTVQVFLGNAHQHYIILLRVILLAIYTHRLSDKNSYLYH